MSDDSKHLALLAAVISDDETRKRIAELQKAQAASNAAAAQAEQAIKTNRQILADIRGEREAAEAAVAALAGREDKLTADTTKLIDEINRFNAEKLAWEQQRVRDETDFAARDHKLKADILAHDDAAATHKAAVAELNGRISTVVQRENRVARQQKAMEDALKVT